MPKRFVSRFPNFASKLQGGGGAPLEEVLPPAMEKEIKELESRLDVPLPDSYKDMLRVARGFWLMGGVVQLGKQHPFFHEFPPLEQLTPPQRRMVEDTGGNWPPPSQGMLCFAEFFMEADGDQLLFDVGHGLQNGEYPVMYYAHEGRPPTVRKLAETFDQWLDAFLDYDAFQ